MGQQTDLFVAMDPDVGRELLLAADLSVFLSAYVGRALEPGTLRSAATDVGRKVAALARERFASEDESRERVLALEVGIALAAHLDRILGDAEASVAASDLAKRLAAMSRRRFSQAPSKVKKST